MEYPRQITVIQTTAILISSTIGLGFLGMPRRVVEAADSGAPLVTLLGVMLAFAGLFFITVLGKSFPKKSLVLYSEDIVGKWPARIGSVLIIAFFIALTASNARGFGIVIKTAVLKETPLELVVIVMLLLAAVASRQDKATFAYIHLFYLPLLLLPGLLIFPLALTNVEPIYLLPVWGSDVRGMLSGVLTIAGLLQGSFVLTMIIPAMRQPERAITASLWGMGVAGIICFIVVIITLAVFGQEEIKQLVWPSLDLARATVFPVIERLDAAFLIGYVVTVFTTLYATYYFTVHTMSELFRLRDHRMLAVFMFPFVFLLAMTPQTMKEWAAMTEVVEMIGLCLTLLYPLVLLIVAFVRKKGGKSHGEAN